MSKSTLPPLRTDFYKVGHPFQYPKDIIKVSSNSTPRKSRLPGVDHMVNFGLQYYIKKYLIEDYNNKFFNKPLEEVLARYKRRIRTSLGGDLPSYGHIERLHKLGYLPLKIKSLPEGTLVPMRVPSYTVVNTRPDLIDSYWLTNWTESSIQCSGWNMAVTATLAYQFRKLLNKWGEKTGMPKDFIQFQGHDFSYRGQTSQESAETSGAAHLLSFVGTDTIPAIDFLEDYYNADCEKELIGCSIPATEHSVMCAGGKEDELETFNRLIDIYGDGFAFSVVSDTWDLWNVLTNIAVQLKPRIMAMKAKIVFRPDSGNPVDIICGTAQVMKDDIFSSATYKRTDGKYYNIVRYGDDSFLVKRRTTEKEVVPTPAEKGVIELLWEVFGGTINEKGYKVLDPHVGAIYGDGITLSVADEICRRLEAKGFASQCVFGIGSMQYVGGDTDPKAPYWITRDLFGIAMKATYVERLEEGVVTGCNIFKDPVTDDGTKKSATGMVAVHKDEKGEYYLKDNCTLDEENQGELKVIFEDGKLIKDWTLQEVRDNLRNA